MKRFLLMVIFLGLALVGFGEDRIVQPEPQPDKTNSEKADIKSEPSPVEKDAQQTPRPAWPRPYKPSEEIRADSSVPFPVDI